MKKEENIYIYNDTFISLLNLCLILLKNNIIPFNIKDTYYQKNLFDNLIYLEIKEDELILDYIVNNLGSKVLITIYNVFNSTDDNKELIIYYFIKFSIKYKNKVFYMRNLNSVSTAIKISNYVSSETHKYKGFLRFKELKNKILYAEIEPINNILFKLSNHFKNRLKNEFWIIKDVGRNILSIYDKKNFYIINADNFKLYTNELSNEEIDIELLWKDFYKTIGIKSRKNDRCRMNFMPKRYWKYIIEMSEDNEKSC